MTTWRLVTTTRHLIQTPEALAKHYPTPKVTSRRKIHDHLNPSMQEWLAHSPFFILASQGENGVDCSPRGDAPGMAFRVLDANTIAIPDRRGNNRLDTLHNLLKDPQVGLVFLIPGIEEAVRVKGRAHISTDPNKLNLFTLNGESPATVIIVQVDAAYVQNARAVRSSHLWEERYRIDPQSVPSAAVLSSKS